MKPLNSSEVWHRLSQKRSTVGYRAMYSSWLGGFVTDPALMLVPLDDHLVHRGDGVFEAVRIVDGAIYDLNSHLDRLQKSADSIALSLPHPKHEVTQLILKTAQMSGLSQGMIRVFVSRGPGSFSPNPYESVGSQLYIVVTDFKPMAEDKYRQGVKVMVSSIPAKTSPFSQIKSCNYLHNVLMKKESVDSGYDFAIALNEQGRIAEGPTENIMLITQDGRLLAPRFDYTLRGTTLLTLMELAKTIDGISDCQLADLSIEDFKMAREVAMVGTTLEVLPVSEIAGHKLSAQPQFCWRLRDLLRQDMAESSVRRTPLT